MYQNISLSVCLFVTSGFAFVTFKNKRDAEEAVHDMDKYVTIKSPLVHSLWDGRMDVLTFVM